MRYVTCVGVIFISLIWLTVGGSAEDAQKTPGQAADRCATTPPQMEGLYYPSKAQLDAQIDKDNDLTQVKGEAGKAKGQVLYVIGQLRDSHCRPIKGAVVEDDSWDGPVIYPGR